MTFTVVTFVVDWALDVKDESFNDDEAQRFRIMCVQFTRYGTNAGTKVRLKLSSMAFSVKSTTSGGSPDRMSHSTRVVPERRVLPAYPPSQPIGAMLNSTSSPRKPFSTVG